MIERVVGRHRDVVERPIVGRAGAIHSGHIATDIGGIAGDRPGRIVGANRLGGATGAQRLFVLLEHPQRGRLEMILDIVVNGTHLGTTDVVPIIDPHPRRPVDNVCGRVWIKFG
jgi:hypothetical protein